MAFGSAEEEKAALLYGVGAGAGEVRGSGDAAEEYEPIPECTEEALIGWLWHRNLILPCCLIARTCHAVQECGGVTGLGAGFEAGFLVGLETPKLIKRKWRPFRRESAKLIGYVPVSTIAHAGRA